MYKFCILLSTYKKNEYLSELIESIKNQNNQEWIVYWREDSDQENEMLEANCPQELFKKDNDKKINKKNLGVKKSFISLLKNAPDSNYYIFCDHDDVWLPNRLDELRKMMTASNELHPAIFIQNGIKFDVANGMDLKPIFSKKIKLNNSIIYNNGVPGCCMAINAKARKDIISDQKLLKREDEILHDWLIMLRAKFEGWDVFQDLDPVFKYRLHSKNTVGLPGPVRRLINLIKTRELFNYIKKYKEIVRSNKKFAESAGAKIDAKEKYIIMRDIYNENRIRGVLMAYFLLSE